MITKSPVTPDKKDRLGAGNKGLSLIIQDMAKKAARKNSKTKGRRKGKAKEKRRKDKKNKNDATNEISLVKGILTGYRDHLDQPLQFIFESWLILLENYHDVIKKLEWKKLKEPMVQMATELHEKYESKNENITWHEFYFQIYHSVLLSSDNGILFLFPFDLVRFSAFLGFIEKLVQEIEVYFRLAEKLTLSIVIDLMKGTAYECMAPLTKAMISFLEEVVDLRLTKGGGSDAERLKELTKHDNYKTSISGLLADIGVYIPASNFNYNALGLTGYLVYHDRNKVFPWKDYVYLFVNCNNNKRLTLIYCPKEQKKNFLSKMKRMGNVSSLTERVTFYNMSLLDTDTMIWNINPRELLVKSEPKEANFSVYEQTKTIENITENLLKMLNILTRSTAINYKTIREVAGVPERTARYLYKKIVNSSVIQLQISLKHIGLPFVFHVLLERGVDKGLENALKHFPKVGCYASKKHALYLLFLPEKIIVDLERLLSRYDQVLSKGIIVFGRLNRFYHSTQEQDHEENAARFENLDLVKLWDKRRKNWRFDV
ncbi:MAG: hypothetical protein ACFFD4_34565 [Candidatus Odinarchaeota archaeon]